MQLEVRAHGVELDPSLRSHIDRRLRFALTRFGRRLRRVNVLLRDVNGPRGGVDILCQIRIGLHPRGDVVIRGEGSDPFAAVSRAAQRASRGVTRRFERLRDRWKARRVSFDRHRIHEQVEGAVAGFG